MSDTNTITIFAIDDDKYMLNLIAETLSPLGYLVIPFLDAEQALEQVMWFPPDLVIVDYHMPRLTGPMLIKKIRNQLGRLAPPCLVLSGSEEEDKIIECFEQGASDFISKPFIEGIFLAKIKKVLGVVRAHYSLPKNELLTQIKEFKILSELGKGGMGTVYEVVNHRNKRFALKAMWRTHDDIETILRFRREIDLLSCLEHKNIARIHHAGKIENLYYYCMDLIEGEPLDVASSGHKNPVQWVANIMYGLASALNYLHKQNILHRDVKPRNVLVTEEGVPYLVDFGLAKHLQDSQVTAQSNLVGTPQYMSPEQIEGQELDARSDLFSLGIISLEALIGAPVIESENPMTCLHKILKGDFQRAKEYSVIPMEFAVIIDRLIELRREDRYATAHDVLKDLVPWTSPHIREQ